MRTRKIGLLLSLFCFPAFSGAQQIEAALQKLASGYPAEKLYIHYDRENYVAGETIWFKAYLLRDGMPITRSSSLYLHFTDQDGKIIAARKYPVAGATTKGNIDLPDSIPQGNYHIRAATEAMLGFGPEFVYRKNIYIYNPEGQAAPPPASTAEPGLKLRFFPESGHLVDGLLTVVAFKVTDQLGNPVDLDGVIRTEDGTTICSFRTQHEGMGRTQFKPVAGRNYVAEVMQHGISKKFELPEVQPAGINLKIQDEEGGKQFLLARREATKGMYQQLSIVAEMNNRIVFEADVDMEDYPSVRGHLITDSLPSGILHFTVFSSEGMPLAERLSFVNNREYMAKGELIPEKKDLGKKAENIIELSFPEPLQRSLSIAVTDARAGTGRPDENIWSSLLLTGDLRGPVHDPAYYFQDPHDSITQALDILMLTQGWSRFQWKKILANEFPAPPKMSRPYLSVSGTVTDRQGKEPVEGGQLNFYAESADSSSRNFTATVDDKGKFRIDSAVYFGETKFFYAYTNAKGKQRLVQISPDPPSPELWDDPAFTGAAAHFYVKPSLEANTVKASYAWLKDEKERVKVLERVVLESRSSKKPVDLVNDKYTTGVFRSMGKVNIDNITQPSNDRSGNVMDFIKNRIQQVELQGNRFVSRKHFSLLTGQKWAVDVFIDEVPANAALLRNMRIDEVALIKFFEAGFVGVGSSSPGGALAVWTKKSDTPKPEDEKLEHFIVNGYAVVREFYHPDHSKPESVSIPDNRMTLYWNPDVYMDSDSKTVKFNFYHNDSGRKYRIIAEGFDAHGRLVHLEKWIE